MFLAQSQQRNGPGSDVTSTAAARQALEQQRRRPEARALSRDEEDYFAEVSHHSLLWDCEPNAISRTFSRVLAPCTT